MRRYKEVKCDICGDYFDTTKHTSCPKESCKNDESHLRRVEWKMES